MGKFVIKCQSILCFYWLEWLPCVVGTIFLFVYFFFKSSGNDDVDFFIYLLNDFIANFFSQGEIDKNVFLSILCL